MAWANLADVEAQLRAAGLLHRPITVADIGAFRRCKVEGEREQRGWYKLIEVALQGVGPVLIGAYGVYRGLDPGTQRITLGAGQTLAPEQRKAAAAQAREARQEADRRARVRADRAAARAQAVWVKCQPTGSGGYLAAKGVGAHGVRFTTTGALVVPMCDARGLVRGLQFILDKDRQVDAVKRLARDRTYWPPGMAKTGLFHLIGPTPGAVLLVAEGYATAATLHEASGLPVAVAFDAGGLADVATDLHKRYPRARIVLAADDDWLARCTGCGKRTPVADPACAHCGADTAKLINIGVARASEAASWVGGTVLVPTFAQRAPGENITDWNDLQQREGRHVVRAQVEAHLSALGVSPADATAPGGQPGEMGAAVPGYSLPVLMRQFALIKGTDTVFDGLDAMIYGLGPLRSQAGRELVRDWLAHPARREVKPWEVGFDPTGQDGALKCNLWRGWPSAPRQGNCQLLLELLEYLCGNEPDPAATADWLLRWIAYPLQNPGAKMATAVLMHGPEGSGKNFFWNAIARIYGIYSAQISQVELESQFNGWASGKLFVVGNEVVQRAELYHQQGRLKTMITESAWMINEKNLPVRQEANHANFVFLSNRLDIAKLDPRDRRYAVLWTPEGMGENFYQQAREDIDAGAIEALHHHLLHLPLAGFGPHTKPPMTTAKADLVELSLDSPERFWHGWVAQQMALPCAPLRSDQLYEFYRLWCGRVGIPRYAAQHILMGQLGKQPGVVRRQERYLSPAGSGYQRATIIYPPGQHQPPGGKTLSAWLSDCVHAADQALDSYRAGVPQADPLDQAANE